MTSNFTILQSRKQRLKHSLIVYGVCCRVDEMDMEEKVKGSHLRGETYTVSQDGLCPRCGNSNRLYVILDK